MSIFCQCMGDNTENNLGLERLRDVADDILRILVRLSNRGSLGGYQDNRRGLRERNFFQCRADVGPPHIGQDVVEKDELRIEIGRSLECIFPGSRELKLVALGFEDHLQRASNCQ